MVGGERSDALPEVLAAGRTAVRTLFVSMSAREVDGRDQEYLAWHGVRVGHADLTLESVGIAEEQ